MRRVLQHVHHSSKIYQMLAHCSKSLFFSRTSAYSKSKACSSRIFSSIVVCCGGLGVCLLGRLADGPHPWAPVLAPCFAGRDPRLPAPWLPVSPLVRTCFQGGLRPFLAVGLLEEQQKRTSCYFSLQKKTKNSIQGKTRDRNFNLGAQKTPVSIHLYTLLINSESYLFALFHYLSISH